MKQISIDFYRVTMPPGSPGFETLIDGVGETDIGDARNLEVSGNPIRLQESGNWHRAVEGEMVRIRMDMLPRKASLDGHLENLDFDDDEGLGEETAFLYHAATRVLVIQRNRSGVSASALAWYFKEKGRLDEPIDLAPVLERAVMQRLADLQIVRKLKITIAGLEGGAIFRNRGHGVGDIVRLSEEFRAPKISISLSMGRQRRGGLILERALALARSLRDLGADHQGEIQEIEISGIDADDEKVLLDLIEDRMVEIDHVRPDHNRTIPYGARREIIRRAWEKRRQELAEMFQAR